MNQYKILFNNRRYNNKVFSSYEKARKYVRRLITRLLGKYSDGYTEFGFKVVPVITKAHD